MSGKSWDRVPIEAQSIDAPLSRAAVFLVVTVGSDDAALAKASSALGGLDDLVKTVGFRDLSGKLSCIAAIGRDLWDRLHPDARPKELKPFAPIKGPVHMAPSTPGDLLFHIRAERPDLCFELERLVIDSLGAGAILDFCPQPTVAAAGCRHRTTAEVIRANAGLEDQVAWVTGETLLIAIPTPIRDVSRDTGGTTVQRRRIKSSLRSTVRGARRSLAAISSVV